MTYDVMLLSSGIFASLDFSGFYMEFDKEACCKPYRFLFMLTMFSAV